MKFATCLIINNKEYHRNGASISFTRSIDLPSFLFNNPPFCSPQANLPLLAVGRPPPLESASHWKRRRALPQTHPCAADRRMLFSTNLAAVSASHQTPRPAGIRRVPGCGPLASDLRRALCRPASTAAQRQPPRRRRLPALHDGSRPSRLPIAGSPPRHFHSGFHRFDSRPTNRGCSPG